MLSPTCCVQRAKDQTWYKEKALGSHDGGILIFNSLIFKERKEHDFFFSCYACYTPRPPGTKLFVCLLLLLCVFFFLRSTSRNFHHCFSNWLGCWMNLYLLTPWQEMECIRWYKCILVQYHHYLFNGCGVGKYPSLSGLSPCHDCLKRWKISSVLVDNRHFSSYTKYSDAEGENQSYTDVFLSMIKILDSNFNSVQWRTLLARCGV